MNRRILTVYWKEIQIRLKSLRGFILLLSSTLTFGTVSLVVKKGLQPFEAFYETMRLIFFASDLEFPKDDLYLEFMWVSLPLLGLMVIGDGLATLGTIFRYGDRSTKEWNTEMAKLMREHTIIVGIGNVGFKVLKEMINRREDDIVVIDKLDDKGRDEEFMNIKREIPLIQQDATQEKTLHMAGITHARTLLLLIDDDLINLKIALLAKQINPEIRVVARMYDLKFGEQVKEKFGVDEVISTSSIAAPHFVKAIDKP